MGKLVISRRCGEKLILTHPCLGPHGEIEIEVVAILGQRVRIALDMPHEVVALRRELRERVVQDG